MSLATAEGQFIETATGRLFTSYHPPRSPVVRESAVLLFYPGLQETMRAHWAFRQLANQLAGEGWAVLRFDYYGTGDSAGETGVGDLESAVQDGVAAARHLLSLSGASRLQIVGLRLGAMVAARVSQETPVLSTILWDPPASGKEYLAQCATLQREMESQNRMHCVQRPDDAYPSVADEVIGSPQFVTLSRQLAAFDWSQNVPASAYTHVLLSSQKPVAPWQALDLATHTVDESVVWGRYDETQRALIAPQSVRKLIEIIARPHHV